MFRNQDICSRYFLILLCSVFPMLQLSCEKKAKEIILSDETKIVDSRGVSLFCNPPLARHNNSTSILLDIEGQWTVNPPWKDIQFDDGRKVDISVKVIADDGHVFSSSIIGGAYKNGSAMVEARFDPKIPKDICVKEIVIQSNAEIVCKKIVWYDVNLK